MARIFRAGSGLRSPSSSDRANPWNSRLVWIARRQRADGTWRVLAHDSWRAGSGLPGGSATELIHGRAFRLSDKRCSDGTLRVQLFIHTEAGAGNTQCADAPGDQICRWEFPRINDYTSHGCIKMSPSDILALTRDYHRFFRPGIRYPTSKVSLLVRTRR
jgi:hypothetical protein